MNSYLDNTLSNYANLICTVCNPNEISYFKITERGQVNIDINFSNCNNFLDLADFENRVYILLRDYIRPLVDIINCKREELSEKIFEVDSLSS